MFAVTAKSDPPASNTSRRRRTGPAVAARGYLSWISPPELEGLGRLAIVVHPLHVAQDTNVQEVRNCKSGECTAVLGAASSHAA